MESGQKYITIYLDQLIWEIIMDERRIVYKQGMPFYPVTFPVNEADGILMEDLQLQQLVDFIKINNVKSSYICSMKNYAFLKECKTLEHISVELRVSPKHYSELIQKGKKYVREYDVSFFYYLHNLKSLSIIDLEEPYIASNIKFDLSRFPMLEYYSGESRYVEKMQEARNLKTIRLNDYEYDTLDEIAMLENVDTLEFNTSKIKSLDGCSRLKRLQCLYLYYNRSLLDISALESVKHSLKTLVIENCGKINDFSVLEKLENLEKLILIGSNAIPSLSFLTKMKKLKTFIFTMEITDGDLTPCLDLQYACCAKGRKYYNLKDVKLPKGEYVRGNENIEMWRRFE